MKKYNILKSIALLFFVTFFIGCDEEENQVVFDVNNGQTIASFNVTQQTLPVADTGESVAEIIVGVNTVSSVDRTINISIDENSTALPGEYSIDSSTLIIPAGEFTSNIRLVGNFNEIPETGTTFVTLNLESVEGAELTATRLSHQVNLFRFCPFTDGATFLGDYELTTVVNSPSFGGTFASGTVTLTQGATVADRVFAATLFPAFGGFGPFQFNVSLICNEVVVPVSVDTGLAAGGQGVFIDPPTVSATYSEGDDSVLLINFTENTVAGLVPVQIILTKI